MARRLGITLVDTDRQIEQREQRTVANIFADDGEAYFRDAEEAVVANCLQNDNQILSLGGGAVLRDATRERIKSTEAVVWLKADIDSILRRLSDDPNTQTTRPNLTDLPARTEVQQLLEIRTPIYESCATLAIETTDRTPAEIVDEIVTNLSLPSRGGTAE